MITTSEIIVIIGIIYICIGILLSGAIYQIVIKSGKEYNDLRLAVIMLYNVILWPFTFYLTYKNIKN